MKSRTVIVWSIVLVVTDQAVKWIISTNYQHVTVEIIPSLLDFKPILNNKSFYWLSLMNIYVGRWARMATAVIFSGILCLFYLYMKGIFRNKTCLDVAFIFGFAGMLCSLLSLNTAIRRKDRTEAMKIWRHEICSGRFHRNG